MSCSCQDACLLIKTEVDTLTVSFDFSYLMVDPTESVDYVTWYMSDGLTIERSLPITGNIVSAVVSGGTAGQLEEIQCKVETSTLQVDRVKATVSVVACP